jgi:hypothetical protein
MTPVCLHGFCQSGHTPQLEEPEAFHALALPFLTAPLGSR